MDSIDVVALAVSLATVVLGWFAFKMFTLERLSVRAELFGELSSCTTYQKDSELCWYLSNSGPGPVFLKDIKIYDATDTELQWENVFRFPLDSIPLLHKACEPLEGWIPGGQHHKLVWITKRNHAELGRVEEFDRSWAWLSNALVKIHRIEVYYNDLYGHLHGGKNTRVLKELAKGHLW